MVSNALRFVCSFTTPWSMGRRPRGVVVFTPRHTPQRERVPGSGGRATRKSAGQRARLPRRKARARNESAHPKRGWGCESDGAERQREEARRAQERTLAMAEIQPPRAPAKAELEKMEPEPAPIRDPYHIPMATGVITSVESGDDFPMATGVVATATAVPYEPARG